APLNKMIAKACLKAWERKTGSRDPRKWTGSLSQTSMDSGRYADASLQRGIEGNSGRDALLSLEDILRTSKSRATSMTSTEKSFVAPRS
ncbi:MAG TPA: radical SAM protein, partial [Nitrospira sp.]